MLIDVLASDNLLIFSHLYVRRAIGSLKKLARWPTSKMFPGQKSPVSTELLNLNIRYFLKRNFDANIPDVENWALANETILRQFKGLNWKDDLGRLKIEDGNKSFIISDKQEDPIYWEPAAILHPSGKIKQLTIYKATGTPFGRAPSQAYSPKIGHFGFLLPIIKKITKDKGTEITGKVEKFIDDNLMTLNKIRAQFQMEPRELGSGADGIAFAIGPSRVLKIFQSSAAYNAAKEAMNRLWKMPETAGTEAMIYDIGEMTPITVESSGFIPAHVAHVYYYIIEKMIPARDVINRAVLEALLSLIETTIRIDTDVLALAATYKEIKNQPEASKLQSEIKTKSESVSQEVRKINPELIEQIEQLLKDRNVKPNWLSRLIEEIIWKMVTGRLDLHGGNLGITPYGEFRYFDPIFI